MKYFFVILFFVFFACGNKEAVLLPKSDRTVVKSITDVSPVYVFFRAKGKDTLAEVNRKNTIISTNWIFNIDKRLPLRIVIPEIIKLQDKKRKEKAHKNEKAQNYYAYADSIGKNLAFFPFTNHYYKLEKPKSATVLFFTKHHLIYANAVLVKKEALQPYLHTLQADKKTNIAYCFDKNMSYGNYIQYQVFLENNRLKGGVSEEYIF